MAYTYAWTTFWSVQNIEVDDCVHKNIFRCTNKCVPRFLIFETMHINGLDPIRLSPPCETKIILLAMV